MKYFHVIKYFRKFFPLFNLLAKLFLQQKTQITVLYTKYNYHFLYKQQVVSKQLSQGTKNSTQCLLKEFDSSIPKHHLTSMTSLFHKETITQLENQVRVCTGK